MKAVTTKTVKMGMVAALLLVVAGCKSPPQSLESMPKVIRDAAFKNAPAGVLVGVGSAPNESTIAKDVAATRARVEISQQLVTVVRNMVSDFRASSEAEKGMAAYQEVVTQNLSKSTLIGSKIVEYAVADNLVWVVVYYDREAAKKLLADETNASDALNRQQKEALSAIDRMDKAFDNLR